MPTEEFKQLIEAGYESRRIEFRPGFNWSDDANTYMQERLTRTILGMANMPYGGRIILGIEQPSGGPFQFLGCTSEIIDSFVHDDVKAVVDSFACSPLDLDLAEAHHEALRYVVLHVSEFEELPIICKKNGRLEHRQLTRGSIYVRQSQGEPGTIPVTEKEMREILERAIDRGKERLGKRGWTKKPTDTDSFKRLRGSF